MLVDLVYDAGMRVLVLAQAYPSPQKPYSQAFVHARVLYYQQQGWQVDVLSFDCQSPYIFEGVQVWPESYLMQNSSCYDVWVSHAPNLRNHLRLILSRKNQWKRLVWVIHGHEVLIKQKHYPPPYEWMPQPSPLLRWGDRFYDSVKLKVLSLFLARMLLQEKIQLIFVSHWIKQAFLQGIAIPSERFSTAASVISNPVHPAFFTTEWSLPIQPKADFITIRPLDESRCCLDQIYLWAQNHPQLSFDIYGKGRFFEVHPLLPNIRWYDTFFTQNELPGLFKQYRAGLMPTRHDTQGVSVCEMATLGMPVLTSDLPVCHEMLDDFPRVGYLPVAGEVDLSTFLQRPLAARGHVRRFAPEHTVAREIRVIETGQPDTDLYPI